MASFKGLRAASSGRLLFAQSIYLPQEWSPNQWPHASEQCEGCAGGEVPQAGVDSALSV